MLHEIDIITPHIMMRKQAHTGAGVVIIPVLHMGKLRHREGKCLASGSELMRGGTRAVYLQNAPHHMRLLSPLPFTWKMEFGSGSEAALVNWLDSTIAVTVSVASHFKQMLAQDRQAHLSGGNVWGN